MHILALTDERYLEATRQVVGKRATVLTCPPTFASDLTPADLEGYSLIYVDLHGQPESVYLRAGEGQDLPALNAQTVRQADLAGTVVFATTCYLPQTPFLPAFLQAGAVAVVGGDGENWGKRKKPVGAQSLAAKMLARMRAGGVGLPEALEQAKREMRWSLENLLDRKATQDALRFEIYRR
jgi:hypothetical protein